MAKKKPPADPPAPVEHRPLPKGKPRKPAAAKPDKGEPEPPEQPTSQALKRSRIFHIAQLMASGEWRSAMAKTLAASWTTAEWKMSVKTVQHYSAEASRLLDYTTGQRETLVKIARLRLLEVAQQDETDRVQAIRTLLENLGELRQQHIVQAVDPFEGWSEAEIQHFGDTNQFPERLRANRPKKKEAS